MKGLLATDDSWAPLVVRLTLGVVMFPHGAQKLLGWWGGSGFAGTLGGFEQAFGLAAWVTLLVIVAEFFGSLGLVFGFLTRLAACGIGAVMVGAVALAHWPNGFFMNWSGQQAGEGFEFHLLAVGICVALLVAGGGRWSVDGALAGRRAATG
jgi:putative oxidoreductase